MEGIEPAADWREAGAYAPLLDADRSIVAWEWLRRDPAYREAAARAAMVAPPDGAHGPRGRRLDRSCRAAGGPVCGRSGAASPVAADPRAGRWGLHAFEPAELAVPAARPVWRREIDPFVLRAAACGAPMGAGDQFDLDRLASRATLVKDGAGPEHLLLSDGRHAIRVDVEAGSLREGPVALSYRLHGFGAVRPPLLTLRRLVALEARGRFSKTLHAPPPGARRAILLLRTFDGLAAGACQRDIASCLFDEMASAARWRIEAPSLRSRAQRLVRQARWMAAGGWRTLLRPPSRLQGGDGDG